MVTYAHRENSEGGKSSSHSTNLPRTEKLTPTLLSSNLIPFLNEIFETSRGHVVG